ncbi:MAG: ABC transporter ATP-binding protein [Kiritimatiellia bacterium]|nr:ABC transporter ATP-binding protein [Kiritimatiellia bacterium]
MTAPDAIEVRGVGKRLRLRNPSASLKSVVLDLFRSRAHRPDFWALTEVSFNVRPGETLGIIGSNGAGKTTLLSLIAGTLSPTTGSIQTRGVISSLLELGAGFHPELSGRENIFLAGTIMGLKREQIRRRFDAIVDFAGLREFIDQPVKHYSSGMYVRLGFAVAVEVDPEILLIDEVLAVGDIDFQRKCIDRMRTFHDQGKTMLIVSHDLPTIQKLSDRILLLDRGRVVNLGRPAEIIGEYRSRSMRATADSLSREWGTGEVRIVGAEFRSATGTVVDAVAWSQPLRVRIRYRAERRIERPVFGFSIADARGRIIFGNNTQIEGFDIPFIEGDGELELTLDRMNMARGAYLFSFSVHSDDHRTNYHRLDHAFPIAVECDRDFEGVTHIPTHWSPVP